MNKNRKRRGIAPLAFSMLILSWATSMRGFENVRTPIILLLFFAGVNAGVALAHFFEFRNRYRADEDGPPATT